MPKNPTNRLKQWWGVEGDFPCETKGGALALSGKDLEQTPPQDKVEEYVLLGLFDPGNE